ncbi:LANO_0H18976g1_1 [Lachancea nothofagi CBS 11611]|uniref:1,3-beta-glucanosyltransferase n=1 Tax=Lachancea nothofagi CBS 11611 TaxID=1266666 RepID=A0A1G4KNF3_9SACH|nr:LANO_0H18976g1_1 [Lachancea nothofagi CBS 11611]
MLVGSLALTALLGLGAKIADAANTTLPIIEIKGNAFFSSDSGERFYIRGVDYQPGGSSNLTDPLGSAEICKRDVPVFQDLGLNAVRIYTVDNTLDHSECMQMLSEAGIYVILDVNTPDSSISRSNAECSYNADYLQTVFATIDAFADYSNVLGFFAGNEVINDETNTGTATYVKAVVRDMKKYMKARKYRQIPVGYSAADVSENVQLAASYFNCGDDADARVDMFGVNDYSWCGQSSFQQSGYSAKVKAYSNYSVPLFLSEFGCIKTTPRPFTEIGSIYSTQMSSVFSGGLVYEYSNEANNYGLVDIESQTSVNKLTDFQNLKKEYQMTSNPQGDGGYSKNGNVSTCPSYEKGTWEANNTLPPMPSAASAFFSQGAGQPMGTGYPTQFRCGDANISNYFTADATSSSASQSESSSASSGSSTPLQSSSSSSTSTSASSSAKSSSKSKGGAVAAAQTPLIFKAMAHIWNYIL